MSTRRACSQSLGRGLAGASLVVGLVLTSIAAPVVSPDDSGVFGPGVVHAGPASVPSVRPTSMTAPSSPATTPVSDSEDGKCSQNSPSHAEQTPVIFDAAGVCHAWGVLQGRGTMVMIIDSGVVAGNQYFQGPGGPVVLPGIDLDGKNTDGRVDVGEHSIVIAGAVTAQELPREMGSGLIGVAPKVKILPVRIEIGLQESRLQKGGKETFILGVSRGVQWTADHDAQIIVIAWSVPDGDLQLEAVINAVCGEALVVAPTGNVCRGQETDRVVYPTTYPGALGVTVSNTDDPTLEQQVHSAHVRLVVSAGVVLVIWLDQTGCLVGGYGRNQPLPSSSRAAAYAGGFAAFVALAYPDEGLDMWKHRLEVTALHSITNRCIGALSWGVVALFDAPTFIDIGTRLGSRHPNVAGHLVPARFAVASADLAPRDSNLTIRTYIVSAIAVLGASLLGGPVILSYSCGRPAVIEDSKEDLS